MLSANMFKKLLVVDQFYNKITVQFEMPIQMDYSNSDGFFQLKGTIPMEMDFFNTNGLFQMKWTMPIKKDYSKSNTFF